MAETGGHLVDLGCGSGLWLQLAEEAGMSVTGIDISPAMVELSRSRVRAGEVRKGSVWKARLPRCTFVTALGVVSCNLPSARAASPDFSALLRRLYRALSPGGVLVFDVAEVGLDRYRECGIAEGEDWACQVRFEYDEARERLTRRITAFRKTGRTYRRPAETHTILLYRAGAVLPLLREVGFRARTTRQLGDYPVLPKRVAFMARK